MTHKGSASRHVFNSLPSWAANTHLALRQIQLVLAALPRRLCRRAAGHEVDQAAAAVRQDVPVRPPLNRAVRVTIGGGGRKGSAGSSQRRRSLHITRLRRQNRGPANCTNNEDYPQVPGRQAAAAALPPRPAPAAEAAAAPPVKSGAACLLQGAARGAAGEGRQLKPERPAAERGCGDLGCYQ